MFQKVVYLMFELLHLQLIKVQGYKLAGIENPISVAEHSLSAAQFGYLLAKMEGADANKVCAMLIWHDLSETRLGDITRVGGKYIKNKDLMEKEIIKDQFEGLDFADDINDLFEEFEERSTIEGKIAKDADYLQQAFMAKKYIAIGYTKMQDWIDNVGKALKTTSAKKIWELMINSEFTDWWEKQELKKNDLNRIYKKSDQS